MTPATPRAFSLTAMLGLAWWALACGDGATDPADPSNPETMDPDRAVLATLYEATEGDDWTQNDNWLSATPIGEWHGVTVGADGRVVGLDLARNNLSGSIPSELASLSSLERLFLNGNELSGRVPSELGRLSSLEQLFLSGNNLSGRVPSELGNLSALKDLLLSANSLSGPIPPELGNLSGLDRLSISNNNLSRPIPPELGNLSVLRLLVLSNNNLSGPIPPELGNLSSLWRLWLYSNDLSGPIPPELGNLSDLNGLALYNNNLSGPIPPELGNLSSLQRLWLYSNDLSGPIPPEFGNLADLQFLRLESNGLYGPVPSELGRLVGLRVLRLSNNVGLSGVLPSSLMAIRGLEELLAGGTDLCAPSDADFVEWLASIYMLRVARCATEAGSTAYLTQAVQSREFPVPLLADEGAMLRVFLRAVRANNASIPPVRATFYQDGAQVHQVDIPGKPGPIPTRVTEGDLRASANAGIPAGVLQPGLEMVIEVDSGGALETGLVVSRRIPEMGRLAVDVRDMPVLDLTLIPLLWSEQPQRSVVDLIKGMAADPEGHERLLETRSLLPVTGLSVKDHPPVTTSTRDASELLGELHAIRVMEGGSGHYMGIMAHFREGTGRAYIPGRVSVSIPNPSTIAHELGHNMSLEHAPCGAAENPDPSFPYGGGRIGAWGYDSGRGRLVSPGVRDLMSYCDPHWVSDYHFANALGFRLSDEVVDSAAATLASGRSLLLWGGVDARGIPYLDPAFVIDAPPALPDSSGEHLLTGLTVDGSGLFSLSFTMPEVADGDGSSSFVFALPVQDGWAGNLAAITLSGPGGTVTIDDNTDRPMVILRDPQTGRVRGILRDVRPEALVQADVTGGLALASGPGVSSSRGIPDAAAWRW